MGTIELCCRKIEGAIIGLKSNKQNDNLDSYLQRLYKLDREMYSHYYSIVSQLQKSKEQVVIH